MLLMEINYLKLMQHFKIVAQYMNYKEAATHLGISYGGVIKSLKSLEQKLNVKLFKKSGWNIVLTPEGKVFLDRVNFLLEEIHKTEFLIKGKSFDLFLPRSLTILTTVGLANEYIYKLLPQLKSLYPQIIVNLFSSTEEYSLDKEQFDIYIGPQIVNFSGYNIKKLNQVHFKFYATKKYLDKYGAPNTSNDLKDHRVVRFAPRNNVFFEDLNQNYQDLKKSFTFSTNSYLVELNLVKEGEAIAMLSTEFVQHRALDVIDLFPDAPSESSEIVMQYKNNINLELLENILFILKEIMP
jgi:DNA-binding transcriptional LysR family regulator